MSRLILGVHCGFHDGAAAVFEDYSLKAAVELERLTRVKGDGSIHPEAAIDEVLAIAGATRRDVDVVAYGRVAFPGRYFKDIRGLRWLHQQYRYRFRNKTRLPVNAEMLLRGSTQIDSFVDIRALQRDSGFRDDAAVSFYNHHLAHALPALFYSPWDDALLVTSDAGGDHVHQSHRYFSGGAIKTINGGEEATLAPWPDAGIGAAYAAATAEVGFQFNRHEGKLTGLAAMGEPVFAREMGRHFHIRDSGRIHSDVPSFRAMRRVMRDLAARTTRANMAASVQHVLEDLTYRSIERLLHDHPTRHLGLAGGVFANVKLNRLLAEKLPLDEIFIFPAMGDDGLAVGGALSYLLERDGLERWLDRRQPLGDIYLGRDYTQAIDQALEATPDVRRLPGPAADEAVSRLAAGQLGAIYTGRMEFGPRALGARSILANPSRRETHDLLNTRLSRSEFMPFAPVITAKKAAEVFDVTSVNARACRYMTIACDVRPAWRSRIPAVVHVDGSARPQIIERDNNPLYHDILEKFEAATGLPVLVNTSFNVHEEPIVNTPAECIQALTDRRVDFVVTNRATYEYERGRA
jgi:carbamoyltransferase